MKARNLLLSFLVFVFLTASGCVATNGYYYGYSGYSYGPHGYFGYYPYHRGVKRHGHHYYRKHQRRHVPKEHHGDKRFYRSPQRERHKSHSYFGDRRGRGKHELRGGSVRGKERFRGQGGFGVKEGSR